MPKMQYVYRDLMYRYWEVGFCPSRLPEPHKDIHLAQFKNNVCNAPKCDILSFVPQLLASISPARYRVNLGRDTCALSLSWIGEWEKHENIRRKKDSVSQPHFTGTLQPGQLVRKNTRVLAFFNTITQKEVYPLLKRLR